MRASGISTAILAPRDCKIAAVAPCRAPSEIVGIAELYLKIFSPGCSVFQNFDLAGTGSCFGTGRDLG